MFSKINLTSILLAVNALSGSEERKRKDNILKDIKILFKLRNEIDNGSIKDIKNLFRTRKETDSSLIKDRKNLFRLKKEYETTKDKIIRDIKLLLFFE